MAYTGTNPFFTTMQAQGGVIVEKMPKFDLISYIDNYEGPLKFDRLLLIGQSSVPLHIEALRMAVREAKCGKDIKKYREAWGYLRLAAPDDELAQFDQEWVDKTKAANEATTKRLEAEIKVYKNNLIKDSIRMGHEELGRHLEETGDLTGAAEAYALMRPDVSTTMHIVQLCKHLTRVSLQRREWESVLAQLGKIRGLQQDKDEERPSQAYVSVLSSLAHLGQGEYATAALSFLLVSNDALQTPTEINSLPPASFARSTDRLVTANDIAVYGGLLSLATMDRDQLRKSVLEFGRFRPFLELEPHMRRAISQFVNGRYKMCLDTLESYRADWKLDLFLQKHVDTLFARIRRKCIINYLAPFSLALFSKMDDVFTSAPGESIEKELTDMIKSGALKAQVDSINKLVRMSKDAGRAKMQADAIAAIAKFEADSIDRLRRANIIAAGVETRGAMSGAAASDTTSKPWEEAPEPLTA